MSCTSRDERALRGARRALAQARARRTRRLLDLEAALEELERLYRNELAELVLRAARLARERELGRCAAAELRTWRADAREALGFALHDGVEPSALLRACCARAFARWPAAALLEREGRRAARA